MPIYLGQHFLKNKNVLQEMVRAAEISNKDMVLEVGPGTGTLTELLAEKAGKVIAVEKDNNLVTWNLKHKTWKNVKFIYGDILKSETWLPKAQTSGFKFHTLGFKVVANLPYYITSRFLRLFLSETKFRPKLMVLMVQKEVADRILARDGKESLLSISVKAYSTPKLIRYVSKGNFSPPPKVDSAIIKLSIGKHSVFAKLGKNQINEKKFWEIVRTAFQQKRKMLRHSIGKKIHPHTKRFDVGIKLPTQYNDKRPENLSLKDWIAIYKATK